MTGVEGLRAALAGRYDVEREVGHGAMATVFLARDLRFNRRVAVKVLNPDLAAALGAERFLREIDILAHLNHPHILPLFDSGNARGLLYYVMPFVEGESLRHRLQRETQLPIGDALAIAREVALALDYAHRQGFIHRDVKPENILLSDGLALVADFGIARAVNQAADTDRLTGSGLSPGTPPYMSPEQASGGAVDSRCDIYALGCVLYELLAGQPPFPGPTAQAVLARHLADPVPPLRTVRPTVPVGVERAVFKALAKVPADRFATAGEFAAALAAPVVEERGFDWRKAAVLVAAGAAMVGVAWLSLRVGSRPGGSASLDTARYAILPFERDSGLASFNEEQQLQDAMLHWTGVSVVDRPRMLEALSRHRGQQVDEQAAAIAQEVGAGRYVRGEVSRIGDSLRVSSAVYHALVPGPPLRESAIKVGVHSPPTGPAFSQMASQLLFGNPGPGDFLDPPAGTTSRSARQAFASGLDSIYSWNLIAADSAFDAAGRYDPHFAPARLWLALVRWWNDAPVATWQSTAVRAAASRSQLDPRDRSLSDALLALARGDSGACSLWRRSTEIRGDDFVTWFSLARCLSGDIAAMRDPRSPSGWRFRSSYDEATRAYVRAFQLLPSIHKSLASRSFLFVRRLFWTSGDALRLGRPIAPDTGVVLAYASWEGDSLVFYPYPIAKLVRPQSTNLAVRHERELFHEVATAWVTEYPRSADALQALAISLDMLGNPTALDTLRRARSLAVTPEQRIRTAGAEVWMRIKLGIPSDVRSLGVARAIAESLFQKFPTRAPEPLLLASIATVTGHAGIAAAYSREPVAVVQRGVPPSLAESALPLTVFSALGGPQDSLRVLEERVKAVIDNAAGLPLQESARAEWLVRPATLAFPTYHFRSLPELKGIDDLLDAQIASTGGDTVPARRLFARLRFERRHAQPVDQSIDVLLPEASLLVALGDRPGAIAWLDPTLAALPAMAPEMFTDLPRAGALGRAMALRAELADLLGDRAGAARWAHAVEVLWANADPFLSPLVRRMQQLAE